MRHGHGHVILSWSVNSHTWTTIHTFFTVNEVYCYSPHFTVCTAESPHWVCRVQDPQGLPIGPGCTRECHIQCIMYMNNQRTTTCSCHIGQTNLNDINVHRSIYNMKGKWSGFCLYNWRWGRPCNKGTIYRCVLYLYTYCRDYSMSTISIMLIS